MHKYLYLLARTKATCPEYEINQSHCLGVGTFGSVHRAVHTASGQAVAIKVLKGQRQGRRSRTYRQIRLPIYGPEVRLHVVPGRGTPRPFCL